MTTEQIGTKTVQVDESGTVVGKPFQHTDGPWFIAPSGDIMSASVRIPSNVVLRSGSVKGATIGVAMQNAKLIAAAPEMLACLEIMLDLLSDFSFPGQASVEHDIKSAISKAKGT